MEEYVVKAEIRGESGTGYSKKLRREGKIPGIFYSKDSEPVLFLCELKNLKDLRSHESRIISLILGDKKVSGLIRDIQHDPVSDKIIHIDVMGVDLTKEVYVEVPIIVKGTSVGVKAQDGILEHVKREVEIKCLPKDIPEHIEIDVTDLDIGHSIHVSDIMLEKGKIISKPEMVLVTVVPPTVTKEEVAVEEITEEPEEKEPEVIQKDKENEE
ncbi:50S ribosomal protein L25 [candidate division KSB1 bacterium]